MKYILWLLLCAALALHGTRARYHNQQTEHEHEEHEHKEHEHEEHDHEEHEHEEHDHEEHHEEHHEYEHEQHKTLDHETHETLGHDTSGHEKQGHEKEHDRGHEHDQESHHDQVKHEHDDIKHNWEDDLVEWEDDEWSTDVAHPSPPPHPPTKGFFGAVVHSPVGSMITYVIEMMESIVQRCWEVLQSILVMVAPPSVVASLDRQLESFLGHVRELEPTK